MCRFPLCALAALVSLSSASAQSSSAGDALDAFPYSLAEARAVVVVPAAVKTRVVTGGWAGSGLMFARTERGWSDPTAVTLGGVVRPRAGDERADVVLVVRTRQSLSRIAADGRIDAEVAGFAGREWAVVSVEGGVLSRGGSPVDRARADEMKRRLARLAEPIQPAAAAAPVSTTAPPSPIVTTPAAEAKRGGSDAATRTVPWNSEAMLAAVVAVATLLTALKKGKRS